MSLLLELDHVSKSFGGLAAVSNLNIEIEQGELAGLIGPNGAGKTTVFNLLTGVYVPTAGQIRFNETAINGMRPNAITALGIARTFQNIRLFKSLSALDNVRVAAHLQTRVGLWSSIFRTRASIANDLTIDALARDVLDRLQLTHVADVRSADLPYGLQRRLEIARALATKPQLLLLDEPAAGLNPIEKAELMELIVAVREAFGLTVLLIEHDMRVVMGICERIHVLDYGEVIASGAPSAISRDPRVIAAYLGVEGEPC